MKTLTKIEPKLSQALTHVRQAVKAGAVDPQHFQTLTRTIFRDSMIPSMGNRLAYQDFLDRPRNGVHIRMDGNDFGSINKEHGFESGNSAIVSLGNAIHDALAETVGQKRAKSYRIGGDEFHAHVPDARSAHRFARRVREKLESIPSVGGNHNLSLSMGFGPTPEHAEQALIQAKGAKSLSGAAKGQSKSHAHSLIPGSEGAIPVDRDAVEMIAPTRPGTPTVSAAPSPLAPQPIVST